ncbi:hypothetical protein P261_01061 [Lachnospiraceae bacterium TWA4]|nr:hypothetical protein P261_01061 [Lachnospiraceae bacterium TWA4]
MKTATSCFLLNMQMIIDGFNEMGIRVNAYISNDRGCLLGVHMYHPHSHLREGYVYIIKSEDIPKDFLADPKWDGMYLIVVGDMVKGLDNNQYVVSLLPDETDEWKIYDFVQYIFEYNRNWSNDLQQLLNDNQGVDELCKASYEYFKNPLFIHDSSFYIVSYPVHSTKMTKWEQDPITGLYMVPLNVINDFKLDEEYIETLKTQGARMFSEYQRGYRILYVNIWNSNNQYEGRLCINEVENPIKPGQFLAAEYLVKLILIALRRRSIQTEGYSRPFESFVKNVISKKLRHRETIESNLRLKNWKINDLYACILLGIEERDRDMMTVVSTCSFIESTLEGSFTFPYEKNILILVNLSINGERLTDYMSKLSVIIREGLFMAGISNVYDDFCETPGYYRQAQIALEYGMKSGGMLWQFYFKDFPMQYITDMATWELTANELCSDRLLALKKYDENNSSNLFNTLDIYLKNERNAMKTSRELYIHRSTLLYRLEKINDILQLDLDDADTRLYLSLSYYILQKNH